MIQPLDSLSPTELVEAVARVDIARADLATAKDSASHAVAEAERLESELAQAYASGSTPSDNDETATAKARTRATAISRSIPMREAKLAETTEAALTLQRLEYTRRRDARIAYAASLKTDIIEATRRLATLRARFNANANAANREHTIAGYHNWSAIVTGPGAHNTFDGATSKVWQAAGFKEDNMAYIPRTGESFELAFGALPFSEVP